MPLEEAEEAGKPDKLAIGVSGGFEVGKPKEKIEEECSLAIMPNGILVPLPCPELPSEVIDSIISIQASHLYYRCMTESILICSNICIMLTNQTSMCFLVGPRQRRSADRSRGLGRRENRQ